MALFCCCAFGEVRLFFGSIVLEWNENTLTTSTRVFAVRSKENNAAVEESIENEPNLAIRHRSQLIGLYPFAI